MSNVLILIPGRSTRQGTSLNQGKFSPEYLDETLVLLISPEDMSRLGLAAGDRVRIRSAHGEAVVVSQPARPGEMQPGVAFIAYGDASSRLMGGDTHGTGMPDSKAIDIEIDKIAPERMPHDS